MSNGCFRSYDDVSTVLGCTQGDGLADTSASARDKQRTSCKCAANTKYMANIILLNHVYMYFVIRNRSYGTRQIICEYEIEAEINKMRQRKEADVC